MVTPSPNDFISKATSYGSRTPSRAAAVWVENVGISDLDLRFDSYAVPFEPSVSR